MRLFTACIAILALELRCLVVFAVAPEYQADPYASVYNQRQEEQPNEASRASASSEASRGNSLTVDLGYERYQGVGNTTTGINSWLGMRFAAPPVGQNRWQPPKIPALNRGKTLPADKLPERCPYSSRNPPSATFQFAGFEDCLFLSVYAPAQAKDLPVIVWIHGGGYGQGRGEQDLSMIINTNNKAFVGVVIQYRLGAFGFLSSEEVNKYGTVNAGLLDQQRALVWVQAYIRLFGGDPRKVTVSGESSGGGSVMLQAMAYGGKVGNLLFRNIHSASPFLPQQYGYADADSTRKYNAFAAAAGCSLPRRRRQNKPSNTVFQCLMNKDTATLQKASNQVSISGRYGTWAFLPVIDGVFVQSLPSQQLSKKDASKGGLNGINALIGNMANEGPSFTPQNISTEADFLSFVRTTFPLFTDADVQKLLTYYPSSSVAANFNPATPRYATDGITPPNSALNVSTYGTGLQQLANNLYAETTFVCPSYWLTEAFTGNGRKAYKYQYSIPGAQHGSDVPLYFGPATENQGAEMSSAVMKMLGNFVVKSDPSITLVAAKGAGGDGGVSSDAEVKAATAWPIYSLEKPLQMNWNTTGGTEYLADSFSSTAPPIRQTKEPGLRNKFDVVDAVKWEAGRGSRCEFFKSVGPRVPE